MSKPTEFLSCRAPQDLKAAIEKFAHIHRWSISQAMQVLLFEGLKAISQPSGLRVGKKAAAGK